MKYFLHDSNSFNDEKIHRLFKLYGYEGLGLFYTALEKMASQEKPINTEVLKSQLFVGKRLNKCWEFMEEMGIISSSNGDSFNVQLLNFSERYSIKKENNRKRISEWRENQAIKEIVTRNEHVRNTPKVKESKVKESKVNITEFWQSLLDTWFKFHETNGLYKPTFRAYPEGKALKEIINNIKTRVISAGSEWIEKTAIDAFGAFLAAAWQDKWHKKHFTLDGLNKKFDEIINNGKFKTANSQHDREVFESVWGKD